MIEQLIMASAGLALKGVGTAISVGAAKEKSAADKAIAQQEQIIEGQKKQAAYLDYKRKTLDNLRNMQKARALALSAASAQGAEKGSGLQGGYGQIYGDAMTNEVSLNQNWEIAQNVFAANANISQEKMHIADIQSKASLGQGLVSLGGDLIGASTPFGNLMAKKPE